MQFSNTLYNLIKWFVTIVLPAFGTLYYTLSNMWGLPNADQVVGTTVAVSLFLGSLVGISKLNYNRAQAEKPDVVADGSIILDSSDPEKDVFSLNLDIPLNELMERSTVTFAVTEAMKHGIRE